MRRALALLVLLLFAAGLGGRCAFSVLLERPLASLAAPVRIDITAGEPFRTTARKLEEGGLIRSGWALTLWARLQGIDRQIQQGAYQFAEPLSPIALLEKMRSGEAMILRVTFPEGLTAREIAATLERQGLGPATDYLALVHDAEFAHSLGILADGLEGYLFPDTYQISPMDDARRILSTMVSRFSQVFTPEMANDAKAQEFTVHQVVTLASVIEKETGREEERPLIASVFRNRLKLGMPLQADPTVIYGIEKFNGNLTRQDLETPTPYNTYLTVGLPPGPISNPGRAALQAALHPAAGQYLYFVSREDGGHEFSTNLADHNRAVNRHQRQQHRTRG